ncbi:MAG: SDR family oxidoreductase, partial [Sphingobium sp.]
ASVNTMVAKAVEQFGRIDLLVNAAASSNPIGGSIEQVDVDALVADTDTKVGGYLRCIQAVVPIMKARGLGCIINVGGLTGRSSDTLSGLRNVAVTHLTKVLADQLGPFGLTVNAVHPGLTRTPHLDELFVDMAAEKAVSPHEIEAEFVSQIPTRRLSMPQEVGEAIAFLASAHGGSINGESIAIDGGYSRGIYL